MGNETPMSVSRQELRKLRPVWDFMADTYAKWTKNNVMALGAALAFYTTFSMAPLLILVIAIFGVIIDEATIQAEILKRMSELMGEQGATAIKVIIGAAYRPGTGLVATIIGILAIVIGSTSAFVMLKKALNIIWGVQPNHAAPLWNLLKERLLSFVMILLIGLFLVLSVMFSIILSFLTGFFNSLLPVPPFFIQAADFAVSFFLITLLFALIYKVLPDVKISWADVWIGAAITAIPFTLGESLFSLYLGRSMIISAYGVASSLAITLMWVYYSVLVFLIGAEITQVYANRYGSHVKPHT
jgi:membrane protein